MGLNFKSQNSTEIGTDTVSSGEVIEVQPFNIVSEKEQLKRTMVNSKEVDDIASTIYVDDPETIVSFGAEVAENISRASDVVLNSMNMSQLDNSSALLNTLSKIMEKFDIEEIKEKDGLFGKLFGNIRKQLEKILAKYQTMGGEIEKIYIELKKYEAEIKDSNKKLETMFQANVEYFRELEKYILAGEQGVGEIESYIEQRRKDLEQTGDNSISFELTSLEQAKMMLEQRTQDLELPRTWLCSLYQ